MLVRISKLITCFVFGFLFCSLGQTAAAADIVINEVAWAGTTENWRYEWIELYNGSAGAVDITGWQIDNAAASNKTLVLSTGQIAGNSYFLICRTEMSSFAEATVGEAGCDLIETKMSLHNEYGANGKLVLRDNIGNVIDAAPEANDTAWPGGDNSTKQTMERCPSIISGQAPAAGSSQEWQTSQNANGTPGSQNQCLEVGLPNIEPEPAVSYSERNPALVEGQSEESPEETTTTEIGIPPSPATTTLTTTDTSTTTRGTGISPSLPRPFPKNMFINEILPSPQGADSEEEWFELYNANDFLVDLAGWQVRDKVGAVRTYTCPTDTTIPAYGFLVIKRPESKITLQNSGDELGLLNPAGEIVYSVAYPKAPQGQSYSRQGELWSWSQTLTPGSKNIISQPLPSQISQSEILEGSPNSRTIDQTNEKALRQTVQGTALAQTSQGLSAKSNQLLTLIIAVAIALGSAIAVLFLNKKLRQTE